MEDRRERAFARGEARVLPKTAVWGGVRDVKRGNDWIALWMVAGMLLGLAIGCAVGISRGTVGVSMCFGLVIGMAAGLGIGAAVKKGRDGD